MSEKVKDRVLGAVNTMIMMVLGFLAANLIDSHVTHAELNDHIIDETKDKSVILQELKTMNGKLDILLRVIDVKNHRKRN